MKLGVKYRTLIYNTVRFHFLYFNLFAGAPKIAPVMGSGWTKASAIHTHHRESLAQGPTQSFEMTMPERNLITMPERNHNKHDSPKLNNIVIDYDIPDTCNISFASVGPSTPSSDRNPHQQLPLSTPDSGVIKLVEQMEADEDYAKQLQVVYNTGEPVELIIAHIFTNSVALRVPLVLKLTVLHTTLWAYIQSEAWPLRQSCSALVITQIGHGSKIPFLYSVFTAVGPLFSHPQYTCMC